MIWLLSYIEINQILQKSSIPVATAQSYSLSNLGKNLNSTGSTFIMKFHIYKILEGNYACGENMLFASNIAVNIII